MSFYQIEKTLLAIVGAQAKALPGKIIVSHSALFRDAVVIHANIITAVRKTSFE
jgi:hypothetical protein